MISARHLAGWLLLCSWTAVLLAGEAKPTALRPTTPQPAKPTPTPPPSAQQIEAKVLELGAKGKLTDELIATYRKLVFVRAAEKMSRDVPADSWPWLSQNKPLCEAILTDLDPDRDSDVIRALNTLHTKFGKEVDVRPQLAAAFAYVYGRSPNRGKASKFDAASGQAPSMEESFAFYVRNEKSMRMSLRETPWPLLLFVADNDLPIEERQFALSKAQKYSQEQFGKLFYDVPYDGEKINGRPKLGDREATLQNLLKYGGICSDQAYFASRVLKTGGVPAMWDSGEGERGGHAWVAWIGRKAQGYDIAFSGRFDYDRYYTGNVYMPLVNQICLDRDIELLAASVSRSLSSWSDAVIGCRIYAMFKDDDRSRATGLLKDAAVRNPYCGACWRLLAQACVEGVLPQREGEEIYDLMLKEFADFPDLTFEVLNKILAPRMKSVKTDPKEVLSLNYRLLDKAFVLYEKAKRPDLAVKLRDLQGCYLVSADKKKEALDRFIESSQKYATDHYGFIALFDHAVNLMKGPEFEKMRLEYLDTMARKVPQYPSEFNQRYNIPNPAFMHVVKVYVDNLREAGKGQIADSWQAKLTRLEKR